MNKIYQILKWRDEYQVCKRGGSVVFIGSRQECKEWIERNGHDEWS